MTGKTAVRRAHAPHPARGPDCASLAMPLLVGIGLVVAGYLTLTELAGASVVCGGLGGCETVHTSAYGSVFGVSVSLIGLAGYVAIGLLLALRWAAGEATAYMALVGTLACAIAGTIFSGYLSYVAAFVLRAVCPWCLASAITITLITVLAALQVRRELAPP